MQKQVRTTARSNSSTRSGHRSLVTGCVSNAIRPVYWPELRPRRAASGPLWHDRRPTGVRRSGGLMRLQRRRFSEPSDVRTIPRGRIDVVDLDDTVVGRMSYESGWRWSVDVKPIAGTDTCLYHHLGVVLSGHLRAQMPDGTELELGPGDVFEIPPGHDAWVVGDEPWVSIDFEAMRTYGKQRDARDEQILASIVFTDIVDSTRQAAELGAARWRDLVGEHNRKVAAAIDRHRGRLVKTTGDGVLAQFDGAERAVRGAAAI